MAHGQRIAHLSAPFQITPIKRLIVNLELYENDLAAAWITHEGDTGSIWNRDGYSDVVAAKAHDYLQELIEEQNEFHVEAILVRDGASGLMLMSDTEIIVTICDKSGSHDVRRYNIQSMEGAAMRLIASELKQADFILLEKAFDRNAGLGRVVRQRHYEANELFGAF